MKINGHIHTPFCPHGSKDPLEKYVQEALFHGFAEISFTEHAPLPDGFTDPTPLRDSAMKKEDLDRYFQEIAELKEKYKGKIKINVGFEVDYIEGFEKETKDFLDTYGSRIDDAILSVHFLKFGEAYDCVDYSPEHFAKMIDKYGSVEKIYKNYYRTVLASIRADLGTYKPKRIGHITLVHKFKKKFPPGYHDEQDILNILHAVKEKGYSLDFNGAGTAKPLCGEAYPPLWAAKKAVSLGIPLVYGSDAHQAKELLQGYHLLAELNC